MVIDDRLTYAASFTFLERSVPFLGATLAPNKILFDTIPTTLDSIRPLVSALYKIGGTLYNISKPESAVKFLDLACRIGSATLEACKEIKTDGSDPGHRGSALLELSKYMSKRWELLALSSHSIGEKAVRLVINLLFLSLILCF